MRGDSLTDWRSRGYFSKFDLECTATVMGAASLFRRMLSKALRILVLWSCCLCICFVFRGVVFALKQDAGGPCSGATCGRGRSSWDSRSGIVWVWHRPCVCVCENGRQGLGLTAADLFSIFINLDYTHGIALHWHFLCMHSFLFFRHERSVTWHWIQHI